MADARYREVSPDVPPSPESIRVHHLRALDLDRAPRLEEVRDELAEALAGRFLVTWVAEVEASFLSKVFGGGRAGWLRRMLDVYRLARHVERTEGATLDEVTGGLEATARRFGVPVEETHHALDDALMTAELFLVLASKLSEGGQATVRNLMRAANRTPGPWRPRRRSLFA